MVEHQDKLRPYFIESLAGRIRHKKHQFDLRDKQIRCNHDCVELDFKHGGELCQPLTIRNTLCIRYQIHTPTKYAQKQSFPMAIITTTKEDYHNISMPDFGEQDVKLPDGEQWKSNVDQLRKLLTGVTQYHQ